MKQSLYLILPLLLTCSLLITSCNVIASIRATPTFTPTASATYTPSATITPTASSTPTPTDTPTPIPTPTRTATPEPSKTPTRRPTITQTPTTTAQIPVGTPMSVWHNIPIMPGAIAGEEAGERFYSYIIATSQERVRDYYLEQLPRYGWTVDWVSSNDRGGYIIYRQNVFDFIYIFQVEGITYVHIFLSAYSPSLNP